MVSLTLLNTSFERVLPMEVFGGPEWAFWAILLSGQDRMVVLKWL
jgi:hypothetical protein